MSEIKIGDSVRTKKERVFYLDPCGQKRTTGHNYLTITRIETAPNGNKIAFDDNKKSYNHESLKELEHYE